MLTQHRPTLEELRFRQSMLGDPETMSYNHAWGGTIPFLDKKRYFASKRFTCLYLRPPKIALIIAAYDAGNQSVSFSGMFRSVIKRASSSGFI